MSNQNYRLKKLHIMSWRRGMKELDLILGRFADSHLIELSLIDLDEYEELLREEDPKLMTWFFDQTTAPQKYRNILEKISLVHA